MNSIFTFQKHVLCSITVKLSRTECIKTHGNISVLNDIFHTALISTGQTSKEEMGHTLKSGHIGLYIVTVDRLVYKPANFRRDFPLLRTLPLDVAVMAPSIVFLPLMQL